MVLKKTVLVLGLLLGMTLRVSQAAMELAPPAAPPIKISGFLQSWLVAANSVASNTRGMDFNLAGDFLRHFRLRFQADPLDGVQVILVPELTAAAVGTAPTFVLLDGYAAFNFNQVFLGETVPGEVTLSVGQFKTPFGLNRMYTPPQLTSVEYSTITNAIFGSKTFWDAGLMATYKGKLFRADVAVVKGLGPNLFTAPFSLGTNQDYLVRFEVPFLDGQLIVGGSDYYGKHFTTPGTQGFTIPRHWLGAFFKLKGLPKTYEVEGELLFRNTENFKTSEMLGINALASYWVAPNLQIFGLYEFVETRLSYATSSGRMGGGINWYPRTAGPVRVTLEALGESFGPQAFSPGQLSNGKAILQTQVIF